MLVCVCVGGEHPLQFKPAPLNLVGKSSLGQSTASQEDDREEDDDDDDSDNDGGGLYVPPRVLAVPYNEDEKRPKPKSKSDHRLLSELRNEWSDLPMELQVGVTLVCVGVAVSSIT